MRPGSRRRGVATGAIALALALVAAGCGSDKSNDSGGSGSGGSASSKPAGKVKLTINDFGVFGYEPLIKQYEAAHPNIDVVENVNEYNTHHRNLRTHIAAGSGAGDIEAIDEGFIAEMKAQPTKFVNLNDMGFDSRKSEYPPFKWDASLGSGGQQIGAGTDLGGLAMCYRTDIFKKAGLPSDPAAVSALWPTWQKFVETGVKFKNANTGAFFYDAATNIYNAQVFQLKTAYYDEKTNDMVAGTNPQVRAAWDLTVDSINKGLSNKLVAFQPQWGPAFVRGSFATVTCPAWMQGYIKENAPKTSGMWNIAKIPGDTGNWGGSWLTIPAQSKHKAEAYDLLNFLTAPAQQTSIFKDVGNFPSAIPSLQSSEVRSFKNPFFSNAPTGQIFGDSAISLTPQYQGAKHGQIRQAIESGIQRVEQGRQSSDASFRQAVSDAERLVR